MVMIATVYIPRLLEIFSGFDLTSRTLSLSYHHLARQYTYLSVKHKVNALFTALAQSSEFGEPTAPVDDGPAKLEVEALRLLDEA